MKWLRQTYLIIALSFGVGFYTGDKINDQSDLTKIVAELSEQVDESFSKITNINIDIDNINLDSFDCDEVRLKELKTALAFHEYMKKFQTYVARSDANDEINNNIEKTKQRALNRVKFIIKLCGG